MLKQQQKLTHVRCNREVSDVPGGFGSASQGVELDTRVPVLSFLAAAALKSACMQGRHGNPRHKVSYHHLLSHHFV
jgi:hypothetical protein